MEGCRCVYGCVSLCVRCGCVGVGVNVCVGCGGCGGECVWV